MAKTKTTKAFPTKADKFKALNEILTTILEFDEMMTELEYSSDKIAELKVFAEKEIERLEKAKARAAERPKVAKEPNEKVKKVAEAVLKVLEANRGKRLWRNEIAGALQKSGFKLTKSDGTAITDSEDYAKSLGGSLLSAVRLLGDKIVQTKDAMILTAEDGSKVKGATKTFYAIA